MGAGQTLPVLLWATLPERLREHCPLIVLRVQGLDSRCHIMNVPRVAVYVCRRPKSMLARGICASTWLLLSLVRLLFFKRPRCGVPPYFPAFPLLTGLADSDCGGDNVHSIVILLLRSDV
jgi:hypothetical protein